MVTEMVFHKVFDIFGSVKDVSIKESAVNKVEGVTNKSFIYTFKVILFVMYFSARHASEWVWLCALRSGQGGRIGCV
jgi:hypothetical protein